MRPASRTWVFVTTTKNADERPHCPPGPISAGIDTDYDVHPLNATQTRDTARTSRIQSVFNAATRGTARRGILAKCRRAIPRSPSR
jgi:hypothetical protein